MKRPALAAALILALGLLSAVPASGAPPCERNPSHPKCRPATPSPAVSPAVARITFGLGSQAENAIDSTLAPLRILSNWYNGPQDLPWMTDAYHRSVYEDAANRGYSLHLITWTDLPETTLDTDHGVACGRSYPLSPGWLDDMTRVADAMEPDYVTLFTEFQTYACTDNRWAGNEAYWQALIAQYEAAVPIFRAVGAKVSLGWGGWELQTDRSLEPHFLTLTHDFMSFQAMHGVSNVQASRDMTRLLGGYGPVMQAHHKPDGDANDPETVQWVFREDVAALFTDSSLREMVDDGLFAWSFLDDVGWPPETQSLVRDVVLRYGR